MSRRKSRPWLSSALLEFKQDMKARADTQEIENLEGITVTLENVKGTIGGRTGDGSLLTGSCFLSIYSCCSRSGE